MRSKILMAALLLALSSVGLTPAPAHAATYSSSYSELSLPGRADNNYTVFLSGRIWPAATGRPVSLYAGVAPDGSGGSWVAGTQTDGNGRFNFTRTVTSTTRFKFFSAKQVVGSNTYSAASTGAFTVEPPVPVTYPSSWSEISTPAYTNSGDQNVELRGRIWPVPGRPVSLYSGVADDGSGGSWIAGTHTDADGRFTFSTTVSVVTRFSFFSQKQVIGATTYEAATKGPFTVKSLRFWDDFVQTSKDQLFAPGRWTVRQPAFDTGNRQFSRGDARAVDVAGGALLLKVLRDPDNTGKFITGHITTGTLPFSYGHFEARIKFQRPKSAQGALWTQSGYDRALGQAEFDVAEFFGEDTSRTDQRVQHTVHAGTDQYWYNSWDPGSTWWNDYHTFEGYWGQDGYRVAVDGVWKEVLPTGGYVGSAQGEVILSLLVNNDDVPELQNVTDLSNHVMAVDWIRVWR